MSLRMAMGRAVGRWLLKPRATRASFARLRQGDLREAPAAVAAAHACEAVVLDGARATWLDRERAQHGVVVYLHGGSYVCGPTAQQWEYCGRLAAASGLAALLVDYRLAPEHPHPAALDDALAATSPFQPGGEHFCTPWHLAGDSAGAGLAVAAALALRDRGATLPRSLALVSPWLDLVLDYEPMRRNSKLDPLVSVDLLARAAAAYAPGLLRDPGVSPLYADPRGLPPTQLVVGTRELALWDARRWQQACEDAGVKLELEEQRGGFHGFPLAGWVPEGRAALQRQAEFLNRRSEAMPNAV
jgi:acetyl esterase/lipase